ncbi:MAG TPA: arylamine N-acetyltransferase [Acidimicrobiales bacterium]
MRYRSAPLDPELQGHYLRRLGLSAEPPSLDALQRLHRRHVERVPYETIWIHSGETWGINPLDSVVRIALESRGGYCYHLNGAFGALLRSLGYEVADHAGGVHGPEGPNSGTMGNHLVLTVSRLPTIENPSGVWYVDVGLGDALYQALPLVAATYEQEPWCLTLDSNGTDEWHLSHDPEGGFVGMSWSTAEASVGDLISMHEWLSTSPASGFVQVAMAQHRDASGVDVIRGLVPIRVGSGAHTGEPLTNRDDWFALLAEMFDIRFDGDSPEVLDHLWNRVSTQHRSWEAGKG